MIRRFNISVFFSRYRPIILAVVITAIITGGGTYLLTKNSETTLVVDQPIDGNGADSGTNGIRCQDTDATEEEGGIYVAGEATGIRSGAPTERGADECMSVSVLNEAQCVPGEKEGESVLRISEIECKGGCKNGACLKTVGESLEVKVFSFSEPYPLTWEQNGVRVSITGASLGDMPAPGGLLSLNGEGSYAVGEIVHAVALNAKIEALDAPECVRITPRRLLNEEGDFLAPNTRSLTFPDGTGCIPKVNTTYANQKIFFIVPKGEREFAFTTGSGSDFFFTIRLVDGKLVGEYALQEGG